MVVIALCAALVAAGVVLVARWGAQPGRDDGAPGLAGWLRYAGAALAAGAVAGVLAAGPGGRLAMRLLALTSPDAEGAFTEAGEIVGEISLDGTLGFIVFGGLPAGVLSGALDALLRPLLPPGRAGGVVLGALLLILAGTRIEPLRRQHRLRRTRPRLARGAGLHGARPVPRHGRGRGRRAARQAPGGRRDGTAARPRRPHRGRRPRAGRAAGLRDAGGGHPGVRPELIAATPAISRLAPARYWPHTLWA
jgi:hypothetical protein